MSSLNVFSFTGYTGGAATVKYTQDGKPIWSASVAVSYGYGDHEGTNWVRVSVFGKRAESLGGLDLAKGTHMAITGELRHRSYTDKDGIERWNLEVVANDVTLLGKRPEGQAPSGAVPARSEGRAAPRQTAQRREPDNRQPEPMADFADDQIPF